MFKRRKGFMSGTIFTLIMTVLTSTVFATATNTDITIYYDNIRVLLNGNEIETKDVSGNNAEPFIYNGTIYVPIRAVSESFNKIVRWDKDSKQVKIYDTEIDEFWDTLINIPENYTGRDIYWRHIDNDIMEKADCFIDKYGADALFRGLESTNAYSQYYCINRLVEHYSNDKIRAKAINEITPFLSSPNNTLRNSAEFAVSVLNKKFDSKYIISAVDDIKIFALFNDYSDYGSYNELWMIKNDELTKLHSFEDPQTYINATEPITLSPGRDKIAVTTSSRRSNSINIIDLKTRKVSSEIMKMAIEKVATDNKNYGNTYPDGRYSWGSNIKWIDNNTVEFEANLAYDYMEIIEDVIVKYNVKNNSLEYIKKQV